MIQDNDLEAIEARAKAATPGPWKAIHNPERKVAFILTPKGILDHDLPYEQQLLDTEFVAHAREDVLTLTQEVRRLREELASSKARIEKLEAALGSVFELIDSGAMCWYLLNGERCRAGENASGVRSV